MHSSTERLLVPLIHVLSKHGAFSSVFFISLSIFFPTSVMTGFLCSILGTITTFLSFLSILFMSAAGAGHFSHSCINNSNALITPSLSDSVTPDARITRIHASDTAPISSAAGLPLKCNSCIAANARFTIGRSHSSF